jgi:hypothetical protein
MPPARTFARLHKAIAAISVSEPVALTAPALPVPTASTKQEHNHDDKQYRFEAHVEVLRMKV